MTLEGFDWAARAGSWWRDYLVALRGFATADPGAANKVVTYASLAMRRARRPFKRFFYVFLVPFQRMSEPDTVWAICRSLAERGETPPEMKALIALVDISHGRSLLCGPRPKDEGFQQVLRQLRLVRV